MIVDSRGLRGRAAARRERGRARRDGGVPRARTASPGSASTSRPSRSSSRSGSEFDLHPLAVEDAIHAHQRPKLEVFDDMVFIVLKTARYVDPTEVIKLGEILIFLGHDYIITVRHGEASELGGVRRGLEDQPELLRHGPGAVLHAIVDRVVDDYGPALAGLGRGHRRGRGPGLLARAHQRRRAHLQAQARGAPVRARGGAAGRPGRPARARQVQRDPPGGAHLLPRRQRPPAARPRSARGLPRPAHQRPAGEPHPGQRAAERGHAQDLGVRGDGGRADPDRRHLRHELRAHAGARLERGLPGARCC